jgi:hypothetical protein
MRKIGILLIVLMMVGVGFLSGCTKDTQYQEEVISQNPYFIVTDYTSRHKNTGNTSGQARVWSEVNQDSNYYEKHQDIYLNAGETQSLIFKYNEFSYWSTDSGTYRVWVENI